MRIGSVGVSTATTDRLDLEQYYAKAAGQTGEQLLRSLHEIIRTGHTDRGYGAARQELFSTIEDLDGDDRVPDLFTGELRGPMNSTKSAWNRGFNTEHTWPQSKGASGIAKSDLHHLRPGDIITNQRRGHHPYGDVAQVEWSVGEGVHQAKLGRDLLGAEVFEPALAAKGDIARGLLYFYTRYNQSRPSDFTTENFRHELPTLLKWHAQDPVTDEERARNEAVQRVQGNRNPFVDHPEFVDQIGFAHLSV